jgi:hypothetical protein
MNKIFEKFASVLAVLLGMTFHTSGQSNLVFYPTHEQFNSSVYNPAFLTGERKFTFTIFPIGGMDVSYNDPKLINKMIINVLKGDSANQASRDVFNGLVKTGLFYQNFESTLLSFGYNNPELGSFNFLIREVEQFQNNFKGTLTRFLTDPDPQTISIGVPQHIPAQLLHYREYSLGYAKEMIRDKLTVGIRAKLYFGKSSFMADLAANTSLQNETFHVTTAGLINLSAPAKVLLKDGVLQPFVLEDNFSAGKYLTNAENVGAGIDLGMVYKINQQTEFSASMTDLGKINWKNNLKTLNYHGDLVFPDDYINLFSSNNVSLTKKPGFTTQANNNFDLFKVDTTRQAFSTHLPVNFYLGLNYQVNEKLTVGMTDRFIDLKEMNQNSLALLTSYTLNNRLKINSGYAVIGNSFFNIPLGIIYQWNRGQTYIGSDNIFSLFIPSASNFAGITFGTCFYPFREKNNYEQNPYLPFYKERKSRREKLNGRLK